MIRIERWTTITIASGNRDFISVVIPGKGQISQLLFVHSLKSIRLVNGSTTLSVNKLLIPYDETVNSPAI